jgi:hypothetical protein
MTTRNRTRKVQARKAEERKEQTTTTQAAPITNKRYIPMLVFGDAIAFLAFAAIGRGSHGEATGFAALPEVFLTALPFAAAWFIVAPFMRAYRSDIFASPRGMARRTIIAWAVAWPLSMVFRGVFVDHGIPPLSFAIVTLIFNMLILLLWRWPFALNNANKQKAKQL